jgi:hypothetical protein
MEMNPQQKEFLEMSKEFSDADECSDKDVLQVNNNCFKSKRDLYILLSTYGSTCIKVPQSVSRIWAR